MSDAAVGLVLSWASVVACSLTGFKLYQTGLREKYRIFFYYLVFRVISSSCLLPLNVKSVPYFYVWAITTPITLIFYIMVVLELCRLVLERHKGLYTLGKWAIILGMVVSSVISVATFLAKFHHLAGLHGKTGTSPSKVMYLVAADRGVTSCLALFLLLMLLLLSRYPVPLPRNVVLHVSVYTVYFISSTLATILSSVFGLNLYSVIDAVLMGVSALCCLAWFLFLTPSGEEVRVNLPHLDPKREQSVLLHLDALNSTLLKVSRK